MIKRNAGFSMIELMIAIAIVGILARIAYPNYVAQVQKGKRSDAKVALNDVAQSMQRCFTTQSTYKPATAGTCPVVDKVQTAAGVTSPRGYYVVKVAAADLDTTRYVLKATAVSGKGQDKDTKCKTFTLDQTGKRYAEDSASTPNDTTTTCW